MARLEEMPTLEGEVERQRIEIERLREELKGWQEFGRGLLSELNKIGLKRMEVPLVPNAKVSEGENDR